MWDLIFDDILLCFQYLPISFLIGLIVSALYYLVKIIFRKNSMERILREKRTMVRLKLVLQVCLITYLIILFQIVFLSREPGSRDGIDMQIFSTLTGTARGNSYVVENVLLFIPLGILFPSVLYKVRSFLGCTFLGFILSCIIEGIQLISKRGYCQIDDVIMNTLGCGIGFLMWKGMEYNYKRFTVLYRD